MKNKIFKRKIVSSILLLLFIIGSSSLLFSAQANNNSSKGEFVQNSEELKLSAIYWSTTEVVSNESTGASYYPTIAVDSTGNAHVAWDDDTNYSDSGTDRDIFYKRWNATNSMWTTTEVVSTESALNSEGATIVVDGVGNVHVAWMDYMNYSDSGTDRDIFYKRWNTTSSTWTTTEVVSTESTSNSFDPTIAVDSTGNLHVGWGDETNYGGSGADTDIFYKRWNVTSSTWTTTEVVSTESTNFSWFPTIAVDGPGNVHIAWGDDTNYWGSGTDSDIFYKRWNTIGSMWTTTEVVSTESTNFSWSPTIAVKGFWNVHVAWMDNSTYSDIIIPGSDYDIFYKQWDVDRSIWTTTEVVSSESALNSKDPTIAVDDAGNAHIAWMDNTDYDIFYRRWNEINSRWDTIEVVSTESTLSSKDPTIAVDGFGNVHVAWMDNSTYGGAGSDYDIFYKQLIEDNEPYSYDQFGMTIFFLLPIIIIIAIVAGIKSKPKK